MSTVGAGDLLTLPRGEGLVNEGEYLSDVSPKHKPWDQHRAEADDVGLVYASSKEHRHWRLAERMASCSQWLEFARDPPKHDRRQKIKLKKAHFCYVRFCPMCQWRRARKYQAIIYRSLPKLIADFPEARFLFLTLTVKNCPIAELRATLKVMARAWQRLIELQVWPAQGWVRGVEITRGRDGSAHPHYHCLLMVTPAYFKADYLKKDDWAGLWQQSLRVEYWPIVDIRVVQENTKRSRFRLNGEPLSHMWLIVAEVLKYSVKASDMVNDDRWFLTLTDQVKGTRAVAMGGVLKAYFRAYRKKADFTSEPGEELSAEELERLFFGWKQSVREGIGEWGRIRNVSEGKSVPVQNGADT